MLQQQRRWRFSLLVIVLVAAGGVYAALQGAFGRSAIAHLQPFGEVPEFSLVERSGQTVTKADVLGNVWVADFIFTRCPDVCPLVSSHMAALQEDLRTEDALRLVSITVDPTHDTPEVLRQYAMRFGAHAQRWLFLTGDKEHIYRLAHEGFHLAVGESRATDSAVRTWRTPQHASLASPRRLWLARGVQQLVAFVTPSVAFAHHGAHGQAEEPPPILHSPRLVLVDRRAQIRQYYDTADATALRQLRADIIALIRERAAPSRPL